MRRKKDDKRVLIPGNSQKHASNRNKNKRIVGRNQNSRNNRNNRINRNNRYNDKPKKRSRLTLLLMILAIVGFVVGAGIGISLSFDNGSDDGPHIENVTKEMTTNLNDTDSIVYDSDVDAVDYNSNQDVEEYNLTEAAPSY